MGRVIFTVIHASSIFLKPQKILNCETFALLKDFLILQSSFWCARFNLSTLRTEVVFSFACHKTKQSRKTEVGDTVYD